MPLVSPFPTGVVTVPDMDTFTSFPPFTFDPTNWLFLVLVYVCSFSLVQVFLSACAICVPGKVSRSFEEPWTVPIFLSLSFINVPFWRLERTTVLFLLVPYVSREKFPVAIRNPEWFPVFFLSFFHKCSILVAGENSTIISACAICPGKVSRSFQKPWTAPIFLVLSFINAPFWWLEYYYF